MTFRINFIKNETLSDLKNAFVKKAITLYSANSGCGQKRYQMDRKTY